MTQRERIMEIATNEIGYKETPNNITKYGEWYGMQDEWCNMFVSWCAAQAGISQDIIPKMCYVPSTAEWFDKKGEYKNSIANGGNYTPRKGDIILFDYNHNGTSDHIGLVDCVDRDVIYTIEGNKDNQVKRCSYYITSRDIRAYCTPAYIDDSEYKEPDKPVEPTGIVASIQRTLNERYELNIAVDNVAGPQTKKALIAGLQIELNLQYNRGLVVDGIFGEKTKKACVNVCRGAKGNITYIIQARLACLGFTGAGLDGIFGVTTEKEVRQYQSMKGLATDGIVGKATWSKLFQ